MSVTTCIVCIVVAVIVLAVRNGLLARSTSRPIFSIHFAEGDVVDELGAIPPSLRRDLAGVARRFRLSGAVSYLAQDGLVVTGGDSEGHRQQLRNTAALHVRILRAHP